MRAIILAAILAISFNFGAAQETPPAQKGKDRIPIIPQVAAITSEVVTNRVHVQVRDKSGNLVVGLQKGNFQLFEDKKPQEITFFESDQAPVTVAVLVEFSRGTNEIMQDVRDGVYLLAHELGPEDYCALVSFSNHPDIVVDFTRDKEQILKSVARMYATFASGVELLESVRFLVRRMKDIPGKKGIVLLATGLTEPGGNFNGLLKELQSDGVPVFAVSVGQYARSVMDPYLSESAHARNFQADHRLRALAENSGGEVFYPRFPAEFRKTFQLVRQYLKTQYLLAYSPPDPADHIRKRTLTITAKADINGDGKPDKLETVHVREYVLGAKADVE
jgi:Ca-activated chloride channel family protein